MSKRRPSIFEEMLKRMRRELNRGFRFFEEEPSEREFWDPFEEMFSSFEEKSPEELSDFVKEEDTAQGRVRRFGPFVYGFSYSKKPGEEPEIQEFGNVRPGSHGKLVPTSEGEREPLTEVIDLNGKYEITVELPGVVKEGIDLSTTEDTMKIETTGDRKYKKEISFASAVNPDEIDANFKHGILTVEVEKKEREEEEGRKIDIK